jgi:hypothetical protein
MRAGRQCSQTSRLSQCGPGSTAHSPAILFILIRPLWLWRLFPSARRELSHASWLCCPARGLQSPLLHLAANPRPWRRSLQFSCRTYASPTRTGLFATRASTTCHSASTLSWRSLDALTSSARLRVAPLVSGRSKARTNLSTVTLSSACRMRRG